jgi:hypothetical protein
MITSVPNIIDTRRVPNQILVGYCGWTGGQMGGRVDGWVDGWVCPGFCRFANHGPLAPHLLPL